MKSFDLITIDNAGDNICIVFSTSFISPLKVIDEIQQSYKDRIIKYKTIYFDFLLCTRNTQQRYAKVDCNEGKIDIENINYIAVNKKDALRRISAEYYRNNYDDLDWTYVSSVKKKLIFNGIIL